MKKILFVILTLSLVASAQTAPRHNQAPPIVPPLMSETGVEQLPRILRLANAIDKLTASLIKGADVVEGEVLDGILPTDSADAAMVMVNQWRKLAKLQKTMAKLVRDNADAAATDEQWVDSRKSAITLYVSVTKAVAIPGMPAGTKGALKDIASNLRQIIDLTKPGQSW